MNTILPTEIHSKIFAFMDGEGLKLMQQTCHDFNNAINQTQDLAKKILDYKIDVLFFNNPSYDNPNLNFRLLGIGTDNDILVKNLLKHTFVPLLGNDFFSILKQVQKESQFAPGIIIGGYNSNLGISPAISVLKDTTTFTSALVQLVIRITYSSVHKIPSLEKSTISLSGIGISFASLLKDPYHKQHPLIVSPRQWYINIKFEEDDMQI